MKPRALLLIVVAALAATLAFVSPAAHAATIAPAVQVHLQLPPDFVPHPYGNDIPTSGPTHQQVCDDEKAALAGADPELVKLHLQVIGCAP
jgi:hypothetical protein